MRAPAGVGWQPVAETRTDRVEQRAAQALHGLLDADGPAPSAGQPLPLLWHWLAFLPCARQSELGRDGHPATGRFLPPTQERRRMYAGGHVEMISPANVASTLTRTGKVSSVTQKASRSGELLFVGVDYQIHGNGALIREHQHLVYRPAAAGQPDRTAAEVPPNVDDAGQEDWAWGRTVTIEPALLFRFSALTYNAHRIHYDREYATQTEGYPGLVVQGPLQAILLADATRRAHPDAAPTAFSFRALAPASDNHDLELRARPREDCLELAAFSGGHKTMSATASIGGSRIPDRTGARGDLPD
jgi:3-methylfumaryl-CoA hydratase